MSDTLTTPPFVGASNATATLEPVEGRCSHTFHTKDSFQSVYTIRVSERRARDGERERGERNGERGERNGERGER
ncbi:hypothetical protein ACFQDD_02605, partial [Halorubrum pallidum]